MLKEQDVFHSFSVRSSHSGVASECCFILGATITQDQLQQYFGPDFAEKQYLSSCHTFRHGAGKVLPLLSNTDSSVCSFFLMFFLGEVIVS